MQYKVIQFLLIQKLNIYNIHIIHLYTSTMDTLLTTPLNGIGHTIQVDGVFENPTHNVTITLGIDPPKRKRNQYISSNPNDIRIKTI